MEVARKTADWKSKWSSGEDLDPPCQLTLSSTWRHVGGSMKTCHCVVAYG